MGVLNGRWILILLLGVLLLGVPAGAQERILRVGVAMGVGSGTLEGQGTLIGAEGNRLPLAGRTTVNAQGGALGVGAQSLALPVRVEGQGLRWGPTGYRGSLELISAPGGFTVVNVVDLESYLRGILKMEVNPAWPQEALKAQAVIARTFAVKHLGRHRSQGYDLCALAHCQLYRGTNAEDPATDQAVAATRGMVLFHGGTAATTVYHADSGGVTADASQVWGGRVPYLVSRGEPVSYVSPHSTWQAALGADLVARALERMGQPVGQVRSLRVLSRDGGGRVTLLEVTGDRGTARVKGNAFRMALGSTLVKSTLFEVRGEGAGGGLPVPPLPSPAPVREATPVPRRATQEDVLVQLTEQGVFSREELMDMLLHPEKREAYRDLGLARRNVGGGAPAAVTRPPVSAPPIPSAPSLGASGRFVLEGRGWGHGVGLSQWGAKALAEQGWTFPRILDHYFPGTVLQVLP